VTWKEKKKNQTNKMRGIKTKTIRANIIDQEKIIPKENKKSVLRKNIKDVNAHHIRCVR
jgi:hypothetical protein